MFKEKQKYYRSANLLVFITNPHTISVSLGEASFKKLFNFSVLFNFFVINAHCFTYVAV